MPFTLEFLRSRQWIIGRRLVLVGIIILLGVRQYGDQIVNLLLTHGEKIDEKAAKAAPATGGGLFSRIARAIGLPA